MNFKVEALRQKVIQERGKLINRLDTELASGDDTAADNVMEKVLEFNYKNPTMMIEADMLSKALLERAKKRAMSDRGFRVDDKLYPLLVELLDPSRETMESETAK
jgi:glutathionylspermidine synthase